MNQYRIFLRQIKKRAVRWFSLVIAILALVSAFEFPALAEETDSPVRINEIMASNRSTLFLADGTLPDWVELTNISDRAVNLAGYTMMSGDDPMTLFRFPTLWLESGEYLVLYADGKGKAVGDELHLSFKVPSSGATITLMDPTGAIVDSVITPQLQSDQVYCRMPNGAWQVSALATPSDDNRVAAQGSGGALAEVSQGAAVIVTEVMSKNVTFAVDSDGNYSDYIEIMNTSDAVVHMQGWHLTDDEGNLAAWTFPNISVDPSECLLIYCDGLDRHVDKDDLHASFKLSRKGTSVVLTTPNGQVASLVCVPALNADQAYSLMNGVWTDGFVPTPGVMNSWENAVAESDDWMNTSRFGVILSELSASSSDTADTDWIELYNTTDAPIDLSNYGLSDNASKPRKWQFPAGTVIQAGQYAAVRCTGQNTVVGGIPYTSFKLSAAGGYSVVLSDPEGNILDRVAVARQYEDITYGRVNGEAGLYYFRKGTPLYENTERGYLGRVQTVDCSVQGGVFRSGRSFRVTLQSEPDTQIYYTLDCSDPTQASVLYTGPISISETTVLRTRAYKNGYLESMMDTQTYLYDINNASDVFIVSLVSDPDNLFSDEKGIMVKGPNAQLEKPYYGANFWQPWEREAHVEMFDPDGGVVLDAECGIKLHGQFSRAEEQQAFKVIARNKYGDNRFHAALFSNRPYTEYQSFLLRSSGQDSDKVRMRDSVLTALAKDSSVMYQETEICILYLNGEYWGQYNIRERINKYSICQFEGWTGQEEDIDLIKANEIEMQGSNRTFEDLLSWNKEHDPATELFYEHLDSCIDIRNYIEYMAVEIFTGNGDTLNVKRYRNANADGKWRWVLFDLDWAFIVDTNSINRWLTPGGMGTNLYTDNSLFISCMQNPRFKDEFLTYMGEQMATTFSTKNVLARIEERYEILRPLLTDQLARWNLSPNQFNVAMNVFINYAKDRPLKLLKYFSTCEYLNLSTEDMEHYFGEALEVIQSNAGE